MRVRAAGATDVGKVRDHNEDGFLVEPPLFAVADGMGGHLGGEVASAVALEVLSRRSDDEDLAESVREANAAVFGRALNDISVAGMGTTLTAALIEGDALRIAHVGDSRAYLLRDGELRMLTEDHTLVAEMVRAGELTEAQAREHPRRSILTRAVGIDPNVTVDETQLTLRPGDRLLLCSDGLCGMVEGDDIRDLLERSDDAEGAARALVDAANDAGGSDNITAVVLMVTDGASDSAGERVAAEPERTDAPAEPEETPGPAEPDGSPGSHGLLGRIFGPRRPS